MTKSKKGSSEEDADPHPHDALLAALQRDLPKLEELLARVNDHWGYEDGVYRFWHQSFKVYHRLQPMTEGIARALREASPSGKLHPWFETIVKDGTGRIFDRSHNERWLEETRPIVEAFLHAKYFLEMACKYARELEKAPYGMPSGWAAVTELFEVR